MWLTLFVMMKFWTGASGAAGVATILSQMMQNGLYAGQGGGSP